MILTSGFSSLKSSAAASVKGATVDEPSIAIEPLRPPSPLEDDCPEPLLSSSSPHAATPKASAPVTASARTSRLFLI